MRFGRKPFSAKEVPYEHHTPRYSDPTPCRRATDMASQRELGLRAQRWTELGRLGLGRFVADRSTVSSAEPRGKREVTLSEQNIPPQEEESMPLFNNTSGGVG